jgi:hypothetical protein
MTGANGPCGSAPCYTAAQIASCASSTLSRNRIVIGQIIGASNFDIGHIGLGTDGGGFPAFWSRRSGCPVPHEVATADEAAAVVRAARALGYGGGLLVVTPVPEDDEVPFDELTPIIEAALAEAASAGISGGAVIPIFILELLSNFMRLVSLSVRLFANILAGHLIILFMAGALAVLLGIAALGWLTLPAGVALFLFEVGLVATLQAFIFATLTAIYLGGAVAAEH